VVVVAPGDKGFKRFKFIYIKTPQATTIIIVIADIITTGLIANIPNPDVRRLVIF